MAAACALGATVLGLRLWIASREWFLADDFYFLDYVQRPDWSWAELFLPTEARLIAAYRPLGLEGYFFAGFQAFEWWAFGYYMLGLATQLSTAALCARIARQLGLSTSAALIAAMVVTCAGPGLTATHAVNVHNYLLAGLCYALGVSLGLDALHGKRFAQAGTCAALAIGVLCNEMCASLPLVLAIAAACQARVEGLRERLLRAAQAALPTAIVVGLFVDFRASAVPLRQEGWFYEVDLGIDMLWNAAGNLALVVGGPIALAALSALLLGGVIALAKRGILRDALATHGAPLWIAGSWLAVSILPFSVLAFPHPRFALFALAPFGLLAGTVLDAVLERAARPSWVVLGALAMIALAVPWSDAIAHGLYPEGAANRASVAMLRALLQAHRGAPPNGFEIAYGGARLADEEQLERFRWETFGGGLVHAVSPGKPLQVAFVDVSRPNEPPTQPCDNCLRLYLRPSLQLTASAP